MRPKPKILLDIKKSVQDDVFASRTKRINLSFAEKRGRAIFRYVSIPAIFFIAVFLLGSVLAPINEGSHAQTLSSTAQQQQDLENQLQALENQITQYQNQIAVYQKQGSTLQGAINELNAKIAKINLQIRAVNLSIQQLDGQIVVTNSKIGTLQQNVSTTQDFLSATLEKIYETDSQGFLVILLQNPRLSDFFNNVNNLMALQGGLKTSVDTLTGLITELVGQKNQLAIERSDAVTLRDYQNSQKQSVLTTKQQKATLLADTKGQESAYQSLLTKTQKTAAQIRAQIFQLLGGGQLTFGTAYQYAKFAGQATGVDPALILAILDRESALGQNVGQCSYQSAMSPKQAPVFLQIVQSLNLGNELQNGILKVSCPNSDGIYGGAMGPAQFLPITWEDYASEITKITGDNPPNPWSNSDAFVATALYLRDAGATTNPREAAAKYYCGSNWNRFVCLDVYGANVIDQAQQFTQDIAILNGNGS
jgi:hypothetical protein